MKRWTMEQKLADAERRFTGWLIGIVSVTPRFLWNGEERIRLLRRDGTIWEIREGSSCIEQVYEEMPLAYFREA